MAFFKCKMCGGNLEFRDGETVGICDSCGTKQTLPKSRDEMITNLFLRANNLRMKCEFDKAEQVYSKILEQDDTEAEAHWGLILCKYGIEYVEDPKTYERIPTCHRASYDAIVSDPEYLAAVEYADGAQRQLYEAEAKAIDEIQRSILAIVKNEKPFDVFICYKETDSSGNRTYDSVIANDIYHQLTQAGFKVFYAAITLEDKLGREYEPYIFAALNSAKVMLAVGTKPEYFEAVWVKNEWSRFLKLMKTDRSKLLIPCYKDMDAYDLPEEFVHLQSQDMSKIGFVNDVIRGIKKVLQPEVPVSNPGAAVQAPVAGGSAAPLLKRAFLFLEDADWQSANEYCEKVLDMEPENAQAYLGKLLAELKVRKMEQLRDQSSPFDKNLLYEKVLRFADEPLKTAMTGYISHIKERNEEARRSGIYNDALKAMQRTDDEESLLEAEDLFDSIAGYRDSSALAEECSRMAEIARKNTIYGNGCKRLSVRSIQSYEAALACFEAIPDWKDSADKLSQCRVALEEMKVERARQIALEEEAKRQKAAQRAADEAERKRLAELQAKKAKRNSIIKKVFIIVGIVALAAAVLVGLGFLLRWIAVTTHNGGTKEFIGIVGGILATIIWVIIRFASDSGGCLSWILWYLLCALVLAGLVWLGGVLFIKEVNDFHSPELCQTYSFDHSSGYGSLVIETCDEDGNLTGYFEFYDTEESAVRYGKYAITGKVTKKLNIGDVTFEVTPGAWSTEDLQGTIHHVFWLEGMEFTLMKEGEDLEDSADKVYWQAGKTLEDVVGEDFAALQTPAPAE